MYLMGIDVGYSNLKIAAGESGAIEFLEKMPAGAGPVGDLVESVDGKRTECGVMVDVRGDRWVAGVEPELLWRRRRDLHADYPETQAYHALCLAALSLSPRNEIDCLVTGLPMSHFGDKERRRRLRSLLEGHHKLRNGKEVLVKRVSIVGQPMGALYEAMRRPELRELIVNARSAVVDAGFYSLDWTLADKRNIVIQSAGTSLDAMSRLLEHIDDSIQSDFGEGPGRDALEAAMRNQDSYIYHFAKKLDLETYLTTARKQIATAAIAYMRESYRQERAIDLFILAGGGARDYKPEVAQAYPKSRIYVSDDPTTANVRGYVTIAHSLMASR